MPTIDDLMAQLADVGVAITDETALSDCAAHGEAWPAALLHLARTGLKQGVRFTRASALSPTDDRLHAILRGYGFSQVQSQHFIANLVSK